MGYRNVVYDKSRIGSIEVLEGETIEQKMERILDNKEPITDGAPEIFTERKDGVVASYNIRTDRWEIAAEAMDSVSKSIQAKRDNVADIGHKNEVSEAIDGGAESTQGNNE